MTGINVINVYTETIFEDIQNQSGDKSGLTPIQCTYFMGVANFVGACMGPLTLSLMKRRN
jgi:hypothetical protein